VPVAAMEGVVVRGAGLETSEMAAAAEAEAASPGSTVAVAYRALLAALTPVATAAECLTTSPRVEAESPVLRCGFGAPGR
jgi:hypothetical protein